MSQGRSINLAMSRRARAALGLVGLEEELLRHGIAMKARMIHDLEGGTREIPYDARTHQVSQLHSLTCTESGPRKSSLRKARSASCMEN